MAEEIVAAGHDAVAAQANSISLGRADCGRRVDIGAAAEIGVHELEPERELARELELDAAAHRPARMHGGALRDYAERIVAKAGLHGAGGETAFDVGEPSIESVADAAGHRPEPRQLRRPHIGRGEVGTGKAAVEISGRGGSLDAEDKPVVLKIIAELPAADHAAASVARQRIQRRKKRAHAQISPAHRVRAIPDLTAEIKPGPARRKIHGRGISRVRNIGGHGPLDRGSAHAGGDDERPTDVEKHVPLLLVPRVKRSGKLPATVAKARRRCAGFSARLTKLCAMPRMRKVLGSARMWDSVWTL